MMSDLWNTDVVLFYNPQLFRNSIFIGGKYEHNFCLQFRWNLIYVTRITNGSPRQLNLWAALEVTPFIQKVAMAYLIDSLNCNIKFVPASSIGLFQSINTCLSFQMIEDGSNMRLSKWLYQSRGNGFLWSREKKKLFTHRKIA